MSIPIPTHMQKTTALDFDKHAKDTFTLTDYVLEKVLDNIILVQYVDTPDSDNTTVLRKGILVPIDHTTSAWRIGKIILAGPDCKNVKEGDFVCFLTIKEFQPQM